MREVCKGLSAQRMRGAKRAREYAVFGTSPLIFIVFNLLDNCQVMLDALFGIKVLTSSSFLIIFTINIH